MRFKYCIETRLMIEQDQKAFLENYERHGGGRGGSGRGGDDHGRGSRWGNDRRAGMAGGGDDYPNKRRRY